MVILVVEDHVLMRRLESEALVSFGYEVVTAANAEEALRMLLDHDIDLLVTDIRLRGSESGIALALKARDLRPDLKVLVIGGDVDQALPEDFHAIADTILKKPFKMCDLEERVVALIGRTDRGVAPIAAGDGRGKSPRERVAPAEAWEAEIG